jgi:hypothetical protein
VTDVGPYDTNFNINIVGSNPLSPNEVFFTAVSGYLGIHVGCIYKGLNQDFTKWSSTLPWNYYDGSTPSYGISQGGDYVLLCGNGFLNRNSWARINLDGSIAASGTFDSGIGNYLRRPGTGNPVYTAVGANLVYSTDNGATYATTTIPSFGAAAQPDCSPKGDRLMAFLGGPLNTLIRSESYGALMEYVPTTPPVPAFDPSYLLNYSEKTWLLGGSSLVFPYGPMIYATVNFGETWINKTGNFSDVLPGLGGIVTGMVAL